MVQLTFSSFTHSKCCRLISATSRMISLSEIILQKNSWERRESNRGYWVRSANATSVLGCIPCSWCHYKACLERRLFSSSALGVAGFPYFGLLVTERTTSKMQPSDCTNYSAKFDIRKTSLKASEEPFDPISV